MLEEKQKARRALQKAIREGGHDGAVDAALDAIAEYQDALLADAIKRTQRNVEGSVQSAFAAISSDLGRQMAEDNLAKATAKIGGDKS